MRFADVEHRSERGDSRDVVHDDPAGEILHAPLRQDAAAPDHVDEREVDQDQPRGQKQHVGLEGDAVGERAGDQRRRDDGEHHLVGAEDDHRDRVVRRRRGERDAAQARPVQVADDAEKIRAALLIAGETEREAEGPPQHRGPAHRDEALHHDGEHVLSSDEPAIKEGQPRRH